MKSLLEEFFSLDLFPKEFSLRKNSEYEEVDKKHNEKITEIESLLGEGGDKHLDELLTLGNHLNSMEIRSNDIDMFCLGAMFIIEILGNYLHMMEDQ